MDSRIFFVRLLVLGWVLVASASASEPFQTVRDEIQQALKRDSIPSLAVAVAKDGKIVWEEGFGFANQEQKISATPDTPYSIASITKPITATALMVLVERGKVKLDQPVNDYLGDSRLTAHRGDVKEATLRRLANHTAGLPLHYQFFYADENYRQPSRSESISRYGHIMESPGTEFQYSNFGYGILDEVITQQSNRDYAAFMLEEVFKPLGMNHSAVGIPAGLDSAAAIRYAPDGSPLPHYDFDHPGASAVYSSAHDLALFGLFHLQKPLAEQRPLLKPESLDEMQRPTADCGDGVHYGIGWSICDSEFGYRTVSHSGGMGGVRCRLVLVPSEKIVVVTLCNASADLPTRISHKILAELLPDYGTALRKQPEHKPNPEPGRPYAPPELVGYWTGTIQTFSAPIHIQMWSQPDGDIKIRLGGQLATLLNYSRLEKGLLTGQFAGDIGTKDANRRPYRLHLRARLDGEKLFGALTAISLPGRKAGNALSYWIELDRIDPDPSVQSLFNGHTLEGWKIANQSDFEDHGKVHVEQGAIVLGAGQPASGITFAGDPPRMDYEITLEAKRMEGSDFFCGLTFPVADSYLSLILGGWGGGVTGLSNLDGNSAVENETTSYQEFKQNTWYAVRLRVTPGRVEAWVDGEQIVDVNTTDRKLSIWWEQDPMRPLGIASWNTKAAFRNIRLKRL